jgi:hypothetical protein
VAKHRVSEQKNQYLLELSDGAIDTQRIRSDARNSISRFSKLPKGGAGLCWGAAVKMVYALAAA